MRFLFLIPHVLTGHLFSFIFIERIPQNDILSLAFKLELFVLMFRHKYQLSAKKSVLNKIITISIVYLVTV